MSSFDVLMNPTKLSSDKYLIHFLKSNWSEVSFSTVKYNQLLLEVNENNFSKSSLFYVFAPIYCKYVSYSNDC